MTLSVDGIRLCARSRKAKYQRGEKTGPRLELKRQGEIVVVCNNEGGERKKRWWLAVYTA
jgi:hypothetical protein